MINALKTSFKIDRTYMMNAFIYRIKHTPVLKNIFTGNLYKSKRAKAVVRVLSMIYMLIRMFITKFAYIAFLYGILFVFYPQVTGEIFLHVFICLTFFGMIVNNRILSISRKKYYTVILMGMDAKKYTIAHYILQIVTTFITNLLPLSILLIGFFHMSFLFSLSLSLLVIFLKTIGEVINILFYEKTETQFIARTNYYFSYLFIVLAFAFVLPYFNIVLSKEVFFILCFVSFLLFLPCIIYLFQKKNYGRLYKKINTQNAIMSSQIANDYNRQSALEIRKKNYRIDEKKLKGKSGYDYFNTIFFLRHKVLLSSSANFYAVICFFIFLFLICFVWMQPVYQKTVLLWIQKYFAFIFIVMYFVNRGSIITQAMFYNCDRSMLTFNFYREPNVILNVFKQRLKTVTKVNLRPAIVIGLGIVILLSICSHQFLFSYLFVLLSVVILSIFFSVHYLVIYYLLQPYNVNMQIKSFSYSIVNFLTYFVCYLGKDIVLPLPFFSLLILIITISYIVLSLILVYKKSPSTFKLK